MIALALIVIIVVAAVGIYYAASLSSPSSSPSSSSQGASSSSSASAPQTLTIDDWIWPTGDLNALDTVNLAPYPDWQEITVYQPLVAVNLTAEYQTGSIQYMPGLADNWTVSDGGQTYTLNLRQGVTFSNGDPFNAYQVWAELYGLYYVSGNASSWFNSYDVFNMSSVNFGSSTLSTLTKSGLSSPSSAALSVMENNHWPIYVTGPNQIVFHLQAPFQWFLGLLVPWMSQVFDAQYVLNNGGFGTPGNYNTAFNQHPIPGTGPYVVTQVSENNFVTFAQNPTYWGDSLTPAQIAAQPMFDPGHVKNVVINYKPDDVTRYTDLSTGTAQVAMIMAQDWNLVTRTLTSTPTSRRAGSEPRSTSST